MTFGKEMNARGFASDYRLVELATAIIAIFLGLAVRLVFLHVIDRDAILHAAGIVPVVRLSIVPPELQRFFDLFATVAFAVFTFLGGTLLFWLRTRFRLFYGMLEVATGIVTAVVFRSEARIDMIFTLRLMGGLYIIVRGLDNISQALAEERRRQPNQAPEPTPPAVTPRADARVAPAGGVAHL